MYLIRTILAYLELGKLNIYIYIYVMCATEKRLLLSAQCMFVYIFTHLIVPAEPVEA